MDFGRLPLVEGLEQVYFFVHTSPKLNCPDLADYFVRALNARTSLNLKSWTRPEAPDLFSKRPQRPRSSKPI